MEPGVHLKLDSSAQSAIDAYVEYKRIVGDDDNGVPFSPEEYAEYKKTVLPKRMKNRVYVSWTNSNGMDCKLVGPETKCFCQHRYREHKTDVDVQTASKPFQIPCKKCNCTSYVYIPLNGSQPLRCHCKHFADEHSPAGDHACNRTACTCRGFRTSFACGCGEVVASHTTLVETKDERFERGHPVARDEPPYAAMGERRHVAHVGIVRLHHYFRCSNTESWEAQVYVGITGFSSLLDGYLRLDDSGIGPPPNEMLEQPTTSRDHPFLRALDPYGKHAIQGQRNSSIKSKNNGNSHSSTDNPGVSSIKRLNSRR